MVGTPLCFAAAGGLHPQHAGYRAHCDLAVSSNSTPSVERNQNYVGQNLAVSSNSATSVERNQNSAGRDLGVSNNSATSVERNENSVGRDIAVSSNSVPSVEEIQVSLKEISEKTGKKPAFIYVLVQPDGLHLVLVTPSSKIYRHVPEANRDAILEVVLELRVQITDSVNIDTTSYLESAQKLYQWLIAPLEAELQAQKIDTLAFSLDPGLRSLPIAALHDGQQFLVEKYSIGLVPSANLIDPSYKDIRNSPVLAMGASEFTNVNMDALPGVPVEISTISQNIWKGKFFLNEQFTLDNLRIERTRESFSIIHLATHGSFQKGKPHDSYIQFWNSQLRLDRIGEMGWNKPQVELLVLSACQTALGDEQAELGFSGLAVISGVKSALASLWSVSDQGTLGLMTEFYEQLKIVPIKAEALRQAQISMIRGQLQLKDGKLQGLTSAPDGLPLPPQLASLPDKNFSHPYYWSAFTMIGTPW